MGSWQSSGVWGSFGLCAANKWLCLIIGMWIINSGGLTCTPDCLSSYLFSKWKRVGLVLWLKADYQIVLCARRFLGKDGRNPDVLLFILPMVVTFRMLCWAVIVCRNFCVVFPVWFS